MENEDKYKQWQETQVHWDDRDFLAKEANALMKKRWLRLNNIVAKITAEEVVLRNEYVSFLDIGAGRGEFYRADAEMVKKYKGLEPSVEMLKANNLPSIYIEPIDGDSIRVRPNDEPLELGKSPVNIALFFDLTRFTKGEHRLSIRLFFENYFSQPILDSFKDLPFWETQVRRL